MGGPASSLREPVLIWEMVKATTHMLRSNKQIPTAQMVVALLIIWGLHLAQGQGSYQIRTIAFYNVE